MFRSSHSSIIKVLDIKGYSVRIRPRYSFEDVLSSVSYGDQVPYLAAIRYTHTHRIFNIIFKFLTYNTMILELYNTF